MIGAWSNGSYDSWGLGLGWAGINPGDELTFTIKKCTSISVLVKKYSDPSMGISDLWVDNRNPVSVDAYFPNTGWVGPYRHFVVVDDNLPYTEHIVHIKIRTDKNPAIITNPQHFFELINIYGDGLDTAELNLNLAFQKVVTASSSYELGGWGLQSVVDGNESTVSGSSCGWTSNNNLSENHTEWVIVNMGRNNIISKIDLYPRNDGIDVGQNFPIDFTINISLDSITWIPVVQKTGYEKPGNIVQTFTFEGQTARYVKIEGTSLRPNPNDANRFRMAFAEIEVYSDNGVAFENTRKTVKTITFTTSPNPVTQIATLSWPKVHGEFSILSIFNLKGQLIYKKDAIGNNTVKWNTMATPSGIYNAVLMVGEQKITRRLILTK